MTGEFEDPELVDLFLQESTMRLERLTTGALELEQRPGDADLIATLFRDVHSIKGAAPLVGLKAVTEVAHLLEDLFSSLRAGYRQLQDGDADAILIVSDQLRVMIRDELAGESVAEQLAHARATLALATAPPPGPAGPPAEPPPPAAAAPTPPAETPAPVAAPPAAVVEAPAAVVEAPAAAESVPVSVARLDRLINLAGDAIAANLRVAELLGEEIAGSPDAAEGARALGRALGSIRSEALGMRMTMLSALEAPLRRAVRDVARTTGKDAVLVTSGERVELDRAVLDGLREPLIHLVRNAVDHGLESPAARAASGKPARGEVRLDARRHGGDIRIAVGDDGGGLDLDGLRARVGEPGLDDAAAARLIFRAGLSTAERVTEISGRGVGMDVVRASVEALRGRIDVETARGDGTTFTLTVPVTLAIVRCVIVDAGRERYAIPVRATAGIVDQPLDAEVGLEGRAAIWVGREIVPLVALVDVVGALRPAAAHGPVIVVQSGDERCALRVDAIAGHRDLTVRELGDVIGRSELVAGASVEPDGSIVLVLDAGVLVTRASARRDAMRSVQAGVEEPLRPSILVVDDALTLRELQRAILARAGYRVRTAVDGRDALAQLAAGRPDLVLTDVDMPELDGLQLTRAIRADPSLASLPVMIVTSHAGDDDRRAGMLAGADAYIVKQEFDEQSLLSAVAHLLGSAA